MNPTDPAGHHPLVHEDRDDADVHRSAPMGLRRLHTGETVITTTFLDQDGRTTMTTTCSDRSNSGRLLALTGRLQKQNAADADAPASLENP